MERDTNKYSEYLRERLKSYGEVREYLMDLDRKGVRDVCTSYDKDGAPVNCMGIPKLLNMVDCGIFDTYRELKRHISSVMVE